MIRKNEIYYVTLQSSIHSRLISLVATSSQSTQNEQRKKKSLMMRKVDCSVEIMLKQQDACLG